MDDLSADPTPAELAAMGATGKKGPPPPRQKVKKQKVALSDFLGTEKVESWADEMDALPSAPSARSEGMAQSNQLGGGFARLGYGDRNMAPPAREEIPLPNAPPFTAFIGNLSFDLTETDISEFFGGEAIVSSVRIVMDTFENKPKGFGYVEFKTKEDLAHSLGATGSSLGNRPIRVTVAEPPKGRSTGGFADRGGEPGKRMFDDTGRDEGRSMGDWTRSGPLPPLETNRAPRSSVPASSRSASFEAAPDVDWSAARGSRFQPTPELKQSSFGPGPPRERGSFQPAPETASKADEASMWRRPSTGNSPASASPSASVPASPALTRRKLELAPRTVSAERSTDSPASSSSSKPSPFGAAAPVNTADRERQIEEKLASARAAARDALAKSTTSESSSSERGPLARSTSANKVDPFGNAKPVDTKSVESSPKLPAEEPPASPRKASIRKEGFSYSKMASQTNGSSEAAAVSNKFEGLTVEETNDEE